MDEAGIEAANAEAVRRITSAQPVLVDLKPAGEVIPELGPSDFLHAGPPLAGWDEVSGALEGSVLGAMVHLGLAGGTDEAAERARAGEINFLSANDHGAGGTFAGVIGRNTPVLVVENRAYGTRACAALNEGRGKCLRYGANDPETLARLAWLEGDFAEMLATAIRLSGGIDLFEILSQALHMGDDGHSRQKAASALFLNAVAPYLLESGFAAAEIARALRFLAANDIFFLPLTMAAAKSAMVAAEGIEGASVVTCLAANGVRFGVKVSGLGARWFTAPVPPVEGRYFEGFGAADASPVIGDSEIAETAGFGAFAMAAAPALARYVGGTPAEATRLALEMYEIAVAEHPRFTVPALDFRGTPTGIDVRRVAARKLAPLFNTGIAHNRPGIGQIGAGFARVPMACFTAAMEAFAASEGEVGGSS